MVEGFRCSLKTIHTLLWQLCNILLITSYIAVLSVHRQTSADTLLTRPLYYRPVWRSSELCRLRSLLLNGVQCDVTCEFICVVKTLRLDSTLTTSMLCNVILMPKATDSQFKPLPLAPITKHHEIMPLELTGKTWNCLFKLSVLTLICWRLFYWRLCRREGGKTTARWIMYLSSYTW